jgi:DNA-binding NtrC family response regulator
MSDEHQRDEPVTSEPQATAGPRQPDLPAEDHADPDRPVAHILILEDDAWDVELAQRLLTGAGLSFSFAVVDTQAAFAEQLTARRPDVIVSDFSLPGFSGAEALRIAQAQCPEIPFIVWSGVLGDEAAVDLIKHGATDYILKDRPARLPSAVDRALTEARHRARLAQIEGQLGQAQRLAGLGHLHAAGQAVSRTRELLDTARRDVTAPDVTVPDPPP